MADPNLGVLVGSRSGDVRVGSESGCFGRILLGRYWSDPDPLHPDRNPALNSGNFDESLIRFDIGNDPLSDPYPAQTGILIRIRAPTI